jgi:hypothetical protein
MTRYFVVGWSDRCLVNSDCKIPIADAGSDCQTGVPQGLVRLPNLARDGSKSSRSIVRPSLLQDLLGPLQQSYTYISSHSGPQAESVRAQNPQEWKKQKTILLNSFWTWNAFVKEWRSVKVPVGIKLMTDVSMIRLSTATRSWLKRCISQTVRQGSARTHA